MREMMLMLMLDLLSVCEGDDMKRDIAYYMALPYREIIEADAAGGYVGYVAELKGCITQAETKAELLDLLEDAKRCWLEAALEEGLTIPKPRSEENFSGKFNLRLPKSLHRELALSAKAEGVSLNQLAVCLIASGLKTSAVR